MLINNGELELTPENTYIVSYPNDIMDGVLIDLDDYYAGKRYDASDVGLTSQ